MLQADARREARTLGARLQHERSGGPPVLHGAPETSHMGLYTLGAGCTVEHVSMARINKVGLMHDPTTSRVRDMDVTSSSS